MGLKTIIISVLIAGAFVTSCKKSELFEEPLNAISEATAYSTPERIDKAATGMYWRCKIQTGPPDGT